MITRTLLMFVALAVPSANKVPLAVEQGGVRPYLPVRMGLSRMDGLPVHLPEVGTVLRCEATRDKAGLHCDDGVDYKIASVIFETE